jgi:uncharacterized membrane protein YkoI
LTLIGCRLNSLADMKNALSGSVLVAFLILGLSVTSHAASSYKGPELDTLPGPVQKTIKEQLKDGKVVCIDESIDNGESTFSVEVKKNGKDGSFVVSEDGTLARLQVSLEETPDEVQKTIRKLLEKGTLAQIDRISSEDKITYDVEMTQNGKDRAFTVGEDGVLLEIEVFLKETPAPVRKAILARLGTGRLGDIYKCTEDGEVTYEVGMTLHRKSMPFTVDSEGELINAVISPEDAPAAVQKAIRARMEDSYLEKVEMFVETGTITYEATFTKSDELHTVDLSSDGKILQADAPTDGLHRISI